MLAVVSPAKSLDYESPLPTDRFTVPALLDQSQQLVDVMSAKSPAELSSMMSISDDLAVLNVERFQDWHRPFTPDNARPAIYAFNGDTYVGLDAADRFDAADLERAQSVLRILSGLYGVLRPLDLIQPYRLEMGTTVKNPGGDDLYDFWGDTITQQINDAVATSPGDAVVVNLASNEYIKSVRRKQLNAPMVTPRFLDQPLKGPPGEYKMISFHAKRARGSMAGWIVAERIEGVDQLAEFNENGYRYDKDRSTEAEPTFVRPLS